MSNTRYLELTSTRRDRTQWPNPAEFEVPISQSGTKNKAQALDPVSLAAPIQTWCSNEFDVLAGTAAITGITVVSVGASSPQTFIATAPTGEFQPIDGYYNNAIALNTTLSQAQRIESYKFLGDYDGGTNDHAEFTLSSPYGSAFATTNTITITDPTSFASTTNPDIFVPVGRTSSNAYPQHILYNETRSQYRPITDYSFYTHLLEISTETADGGAVSTWTATDCFSIRRSPPSLIGATPSGANTVRTVVLPSTASSTNSFYVGDFIYIPMTASPLAAPQGQARRIVAYDGTTQTVTVDPAFTAVPAMSTQIQILPFAYDNAAPFNYTGSLVSQNQQVCYELELINLILPNRTLDIGQGGRIAFYPYVYVELQNISGSSSGNEGVIYSNNPNSNKMLFRATIDDTPTPLISPFIKIDGDGMVQTVKFRPNDNLKFAVRMPDGELFKTLTTETLGPNMPNDLLQISAMVSLKRL